MAREHLKTFKSISESISYGNSGEIILYDFTGQQVELTDYNGNCKRFKKFAPLETTSLDNKNNGLECRQQCLLVNTATGCEYSINDRSCKVHFGDFTQGQGNSEDGITCWIFSGKYFSSLSDYF